MNNNQGQFQNKPTNNIGFNINSDQDIQQPMTQVDSESQTYVSEPAPKRKANQKPIRD